MRDMWFFVSSSGQHGPCSVEQLTELAACGGVQPGTLVWKEGMPGWTPANAVSELVNLVFSAAPASNKVNNRPTKGESGNEGWVVGGGVLLSAAVIALLYGVQSFIRHPAGNNRFGEV